MKSNLILMLFDDRKFIETMEWWRAGESPLEGFVAGRDVPFGERGVPLVLGDVEALEEIDDFHVVTGEGLGHALGFDEDVAVLLGEGFQGLLAILGVGGPGFVSVEVGVVEGGEGREVLLVFAALDGIGDLVVTVNGTINSEHLGFQ